MSDLTDLYQEVILDHNRNPRNQHRPEGANRCSDGYNPLCGDQLSIYIRMDGDVIEEIGFQGTGCAISQASASVMTTALKGKTLEEAEELFRRFQSVVTGKSGEADDLAYLGELAAMAGVSQFPSRVKCATLSWHTVMAALKDQGRDCSEE